MQMERFGIGIASFTIKASDGYGGEAEKDIAIDEHSEIIDLNKILLSNQPNPFKSSTQISYQIKKAGHVKMQIYSSEGKLVGVLVDEYKEAGSYSFMFDRKTNSTGVFFCIILVNDQIVSNRMIVE